MTVRLGIIGKGYMADVVRRSYDDGLLPGYEPVRSIGSRDDIEDILTDDIDMVLELASVEAVKKHALRVIEKGKDLVCLSVGAFADNDLYEQVTKKAAEKGVSVYIPSGSIGGFDALQTISLMDPYEAELVMRKTPETLIGTGIWDESFRSLKEETLVFEGTAAEAIKIMPTKFNVGVASALQTLGPDKMKVKLYIGPEIKEDDITVSVRSSDASCKMNFTSRPYDIAGYSVTALLRSIASPVRFI